MKAFLSAENGCCMLGDYSLRLYLCLSRAAAELYGEQGVRHHVHTQEKMKKSNMKEVQLCLQEAWSSSAVTCEVSAYCLQKPTNRLQERFLFCKCFWFYSKKRIFIFIFFLLLRVLFALLLLSETVQKKWKYS